MISDEIKEKIQKEAKRHLLEEDYPRMDMLFRECYVIHEDEYTMIVLAPIYTLGMKFNLENGEFAGPENWQYAKDIGELVEWQ